MFRTCWTHETEFLYEKQEHSVGMYGSIWKVLKCYTLEMFCSINYLVMRITVLHWVIYLASLQQPDPMKWNVKYKALLALVASVMVASPPFPSTPCSLVHRVQMKPGDRKWCSSPCSMTHGMGKGVEFSFLPLSGGTAGFACYTTCPEKISRPPKTSITGAWWPRVCLPLLLAVAFNFFPTSPSPLAFLLSSCWFFFHVFFLLIPLSTLLLIFFVLICGSSNNFHSLCPYHNLS